MIGEVHLDQDPPTSENQDMILKTTQAEDSLRRYLVQHCGVNHFFLELPNCYDYFIREYMDSGDSSWIAFVQNSPYVYSRLKSLHALKVEFPSIRVTCVDVNYPKYADRTIFALLTLIFYDHYTKVYYPPYSHSAAVPVAADLNIALSIIKSDTVHITPRLRIFFADLITILTQQNADPDLLYNTLIALSKNQPLLLDLSALAADSWTEMQLIMNSFLDSYPYKEIDSRMLLARESLLYTQMHFVMHYFPENVFCMQFGDVHTQVSQYDNTVRSLLFYKNETMPFCIHLIPKTFSERLQEIYITDYHFNFDFQESWCLQKQGENDAGILIR